MSAVAADPKAPISVRVVDRVSRALAGTSLSRRRFLYRLAVVGSALAVNPLQYILRPISAYASVCGDGATCSSGWSVFCCTINDGANTCPDGSYVAGWWKVDASAFCLGAPRYYVDCNRLPGSSCRCRCNDTGCDNRRTCCNNFRYGQCNTQISGVTEVVCRIIVCTPPWVWDPACGRTVRTSPSTWTHSASCLPGEWPSHIEIKYQDMGLSGSVLGAATETERSAPRGGRRRRYENGYIYWRSELGAQAVVGEFAAKYGRAGLAGGPLGYPLAGRRRFSGGVTQPFEGGQITGPSYSRVFAVWGPIAERYADNRGPQGSWGLPTSDTREVRGGHESRFESGAAYMSAGAVHWLSGTILDRYDAGGGPSGSLGLPTSSAVNTITGGQRASFQHGAIEIAPGTSTAEIVNPRSGRSASELPSTSSTKPRPGRVPSELP